ncbi:MarR family transcriptional regulator [Vineibacter terrae]|uniref:MarR family winged helix-turn-helix transcriptional regulator n=1 Tax=Vineibacter terrae TaxID=2586908 RepID=UPI002E32BDC9|nr:MarR family transcriptional regulator [Vineibacter terrae]HEX2888217.1 MarR family transcriptional regulator [Vineibacter terrae]
MPSPDTAEPGSDGLDRGMLPGLVGYALRRAQVAVFQDFAREMAAMRVPVTPGEFGILVLVSRNPGLSQTALARAIGVDRSTLVPILDRLERHGLIKRHPSPTDRRSHALELGTAGVALLPLYEAAVRRHERRIQRRLRAGEGGALIAALDLVLDGAMSR